MLQIKKGGRLIKEEWVYDEIKGEGYYQDVDITDQGIRHLFTECTLADNVLLRDILLLLHNDVDIYDAVLGNWTKQLVEEGLTKPFKTYEYGPENLEYLELSFTPELQKNLSKSQPEALQGLSFPDLNGVGWALKEEWQFGDHTFKKGERIPWSLSLTPVNELVEIPVKLSNTLKIMQCDYSDTVNKTEWWKPVAKFNNPQYTLGQILYAIVWELSFHGGPEDRDKFENKLNEMRDQVNKEYETDKN